MEVLVILGLIALVGFIVMSAVVLGTLALFFKLVFFLLFLPFMILGVVLKSLLWVIFLPFKILGGILRAIF